MDGEITKSLEIWSIITIYDLSLLLLMVGGILHFAENYYTQSLSNFKIRVSQENWSILFFLFRDFSLFLSYVLSLLLINPDMFADVKFPLPFFPLGVIFLGIALIFKLRNEPKKKLFNFFLGLSLVVQYLGFVFVMEAAPEEWTNSSAFWSFMSNLRSVNNPQLSMLTFYAAFPILLIINILLLHSARKKSGVNQ